jgi:putative ABC transport system permease protein
MDVWSQIRVAFRHLRASPGYGIAVVLTLAVAIGANSAIFSAVHAVLLRPIPVTDPNRVVMTWRTDPGRGQGVVELAHRHLREFVSQGTTFSSAALVGSTNWPAVLEGRGEPAKLAVAGVSGTFFDTLGVAPLAGRTLAAADDVPNAASVVVISHGLWTRHFGSDPRAIGTMARISGQPVQIVGVMPATFDFPRGADFWTPIVPILAGAGAQPNLNNLNNVGVSLVVGRLRPGVSVDAAVRQLDDLEARLKLENPGREPWGERAVVTSLEDYLFGPVKPALWALWAAVTVLLLIACANISGLMLTRVSLRRREHAIRLALGATRSALGRLWVVEILALTVIGGLLGLAIAHGLVRAIVALAPDDLPRLAEVSIDGTVALFTFGVMFAAALLCGAMPIRHAATATLRESMEDGARATAGRAAVGARSLLLVCQIGLAVVLLVASGLIVRSFVKLRQIDLGFNPAGVLTLNIDTGGPPAQANPLLHTLLRDIGAMPGVEATGAVYLRPLALGRIGQGVLVQLDGQSDATQELRKNPILNHQIATPGYFSAMRAPLVRGRFFTDQDNAQAPRVVIVAETTARRLWPGEDPIGKRLAMSAFTPGTKGRPWRTVVGVVRDMRYRGLDEVQLDIYDPALQVGRPANNLVVRTSGDPVTLAGLVRARARQLDPESIVDGITTMDAVVTRAAAPWRLSMWMFLLFAALAMTLAALGLFSLVSLDVAHRRREFAVRLAFGATRRAILQKVLVTAGWRVGVGMAAGLGVAMLAARALRSLLFEVHVLDTATYGGVIALVLAVVAIAALLPARRAAGIDPVVLLRD